MGLRKPVAAEALREVVHREHERDQAGLLAQLRTGDSTQRRWAARELVAHPEVALTLGEHLLREADTTVRETVFTSLIGMANADAAQAVIPLLRSEDPGLRNGAIEALSSMPNVAGPHVDQLLHDPDPDVRIFTVNLLAELKHPRVQEWLQWVMEHDQHVNVLAAAVEVLTEVGTPEVLPALRSVSERLKNEPFLSFAIDVAIDRIEST